MKMLETCFNQIDGRNAYRVIDDADDQTTAGTGRDVFVICKLLPRDLETVTTRARIVVDTLCLVPAHVLDLNLVVVCAHRERKQDEAENDSDLLLSQPGGCADCLSFEALACHPKASLSTLDLG